MMTDGFAGKPIDKYAEQAVAAGGQWGLFEHNRVKLALEKNTGGGGRTDFEVHADYGAASIMRIKGQEHELVALHEKTAIQNAASPEGIKFNTFLVSSIDKVRADKMSGTSEVKRTIFDEVERLQLNLDPDHPVLSQVLTDFQQYLDDGDKVSLSEQRAWVNNRMGQEQKDAFERDEKVRLRLAPAQTVNQGLDKVKVLDADRETFTAQDDMVNAKVDYYEGLHDEFRFGAAFSGAGRVPTDPEGEFRGKNPYKEDLRLAKKEAKETRQDRVDAEAKLRGAKRHLVALQRSAASRGLGDDDLIFNDTYLGEAEVTNVTTKMRSKE